MIEVGTIIRTKHNTHNYPERDGDRWNYKYFKLCDGPFEITSIDWENRKFEGKHFICEGSDYWVTLKGEVFGLELLEGEYEIVNELPNDLKP